MATVHISGPVKEMLDNLEGETFEFKILTLIQGDLENRLRGCTERIYTFEKNYGMTFEEFRDAWEKGSLTDKHAHEIERNFMEWESLTAEHTLLLSQLRTTRTTCHL